MTRKLFVAAFVVDGEAFGFDPGKDAVVEFLVRAGQEDGFSDWIVFDRADLVAIMDEAREPLQALRQRTRDPGGARPGGGSSMTVSDQAMLCAGIALGVLDRLDAALDPTDPDAGPEPDLPDVIKDNAHLIGGAS